MSQKFMINKINVCILYIYVYPLYTYICTTDHGSTLPSLHTHPFAHMHKVSHGNFNVTCLIEDNTIVILTAYLLGAWCFDTCYSDYLHYSIYLHTHVAYRVHPHLYVIRDIIGCLVHLDNFFTYVHYNCMMAISIL